MADNVRCLTCLSFRNKETESEWEYKEIPLFILNKLKKVANIKV